MRGRLVLVEGLEITWEPLGPFWLQCDVMPLQVLTEAERTAAEEAAQSDLKC